MDVSDHRSNSYEQIEFAVKQIGNSKDRRAVFNCISTGKKAIKTVAEISDLTGLPPKRVLEEGKKLANNSIVKQLKYNKKVAYQKDPFFAQQKNKILSLVDNPATLEKLPSKRNKSNSDIQLKIIRIPQKSFTIKRLFVNDIDSFKKVRKVNPNKLVSSRISEDAFKSGIKQILNEEGEFKDWGGEKNDLLSTKVIYKGKRIATAFAFKGPGKKGKLTPARMGKNGDQIQRLFETPADLFIIQYWAQIDESVIEQAESFATIKSIYEQKKILYCIVDGQDSSLLMSAYSECFVF